MRSPAVSRAVLCAREPVHTKERGFALLVVFLMAAAIAFTLYLQLPRVAFESQRDKEELLIERGEQFKRGIQLFVIANKRFPAKIEDLENTNQKRYLRRRYVDPMTGKDEWRLIHVNAAGMLTDSLVQKPPAANAGANTTAGVQAAGNSAAGALGNPAGTNASPFGGAGVGGFGPGNGQPQNAGTAGQSAGQSNDPNNPGSTSDGPQPVNAAVLRRPSDRLLVPNQGNFAGTPPQEEFDDPSKWAPISLAPTQQVNAPGNQQNFGQPFGAPFGQPFGQAGQPNAQGIPGQPFPNQFQNQQFPGQAQPVQGQLPFPAQSQFQNQAQGFPGQNQPSPSPFPQPNGNDMTALQQFIGQGQPAQGQPVSVQPQFGFPGESGVPAQNVVGAQPGFPNRFPDPSAVNPSSFPQRLPNQNPNQNQVTIGPNGQFVPVQNFPGQTPNGRQAGGGFQQAAGGGGATPGAPNSAVQLINDLLTRPGQAPNAAGNNAGGIGAGIAGVASTADSPSIKIYGERQKYKEWEFVFDMKSVQPGAAQQRPGQAQNPLGSNPSQPNPVSNQTGTPNTPNSNPLGLTPFSAR